MLLASSCTWQLSLFIPEACRRRRGIRCRRWTRTPAGRPADQLRDWAETRSPAWKFRSLRSRPTPMPPGSPRWRTRSAISRGPRWRASVRWRVITAPTGARRWRQRRRDPPIRGVRLTAPAATCASSTTTRDERRQADWRAMGPMQFISETWRLYGVDANNDGIASARTTSTMPRSRRRAICAGAERISRHRGGGSPHCGPTTTPASTRAPCATGQPLTQRVTRYSRMNR